MKNVLYYARIRASKIGGYNGVNGTKLGPRVKSALSVCISCSKHLTIERVTKFEKWSSKTIPSFMKIVKLIEIFRFIIRKLLERKVPQGLKTENWFVEPTQEPSRAQWSSWCTGTLHEVFGFWLHQNWFLFVKASELVLLMSDWLQMLTQQSTEWFSSSSWGLVV